MKQIVYVIAVVALTALISPVYAADNLSINLSGFAFYAPSVPFKDLMFQSSKDGKYHFNSNTVCQQQPEDVDGYPLSLDTADNCFYQYYLVPGVAYPQGHYVFTYSGTGAIALGGDIVNPVFVSQGRFEFDVAAAKYGIWITILSTSGTDHLRNFHVFLASDEATYQTQPFQQKFLDFLSPFSIIRFMNWSGVVQPKNLYFSNNFTQPDGNTIVLAPGYPTVSLSGTAIVAMVHVPTGNQWPRVFVDSYDGTTGTIHLTTPVPLGATEVYLSTFPNQTWAQRTQVGNQHQQGPSGVAYEYMIQLANVTNKDIWINIPTAADDDFITQLAMLLKNTLNPNLKIYLEYSNETWNFQFPGYDYSEAMQKKLGLVGSGVIVPADAWHPYRALQIFHLFNQVFGEQDLTAQRTNSRLIRILTSQTGWFARFADVVEWTNSGGAAPTYGLSANQYADAVAVTDYWTFPATGFDVSTFLQLTPDQMVTELIKLQIQAIDEAVAQTDPNGNNYLYTYAQAAQNLGIKLIAYEGGEGFVPNIYPAQYVNGITGLLEGMNHDPRMADVYLESLSKWQWLATQFPGAIGNWSQYNDIGGCSKYGCWGLLDSEITQDPSTAPRYKGILNFLNKNKNAPPTF